MGELGHHGVDGPLLQRPVLLLEKEELRHKGGHTQNVVVQAGDHRGAGLHLDGLGRGRGEAVLPQGA